jgi:uncharacterized protein YhbP (UPF0306 family)
MTPDPEGRPAEQGAYDAAANSLIRECSTVVLAVAEGRRPWCAPVYYVYFRGGLYFYSSPNASHIRNCPAGGECAAAVFNESRRLEDIQGLQMRGRLAEVSQKAFQARVAGHYLVKFPFAAGVLTEATAGARDRIQSVRLYCFQPSEVHMTSNRLGFGRRVRVRID